MTRYRLLPLAAVAGLALAACEARIGNHASADAGNGSAEGKAEEGRLSISAPGFEMKVNIPESIRREAGIDDDSGVIYPNSRFSGIHVEGGGEASRRDGEVELRFASVDSPETIARWYGDPARAADFTVSSAGREGDAFVVAGTTKDDDGQFRVRLAPRAGGGTDGRVVLAERH